MISGIFALRAYLKLTPEQKTFLSNKTYEASMPASEWLALIENISRFDHHLDAFRGLCGWIGFLLMLGGGVQVFFTGQLNPYLLLIGGGFLFVYFIVRLADIHNNLRRFVLPMLRILQMDLHDETPINMKLDLRGNKFYTKLEDTIEGDRREDEIYIDPWLSASTRLQDGTSLQWSITEKFRYRTQRNYRGKVKVKFKRKRRYEVQLGFSQAQYRVVDSRLKAFRHSSYQSKRKKGSKRDRVRLRQQTVDTDEVSYADIHEFTELLYTAYGMLTANSAKKGS